MRFVSRTVPRLVEKYSYDEAVGPATPAQGFELTRQDAEILASDVRTLTSMDVNVNHRPDAPVGKVVKAWVHGNSMYHLGTVHDEATKKELRAGNLRNTSLFHMRHPRLCNVELTLCALKGSRPGSGVIDIYDDDVDNAALRSKVPALVAASDEELNGYALDEKDDFESQRAHYLRYAAVAASSETLGVVAPLFEDPSKSVLLRMTSAEAPMPDSIPVQGLPAAPAPVAAAAQAPAPAATTTVAFTKSDGTAVSFEKKVPVEGSVPPRASEELEAKMKKFEEEGAAPDDAQPGETYLEYLVRKFADSKQIPSQAMKNRILKDRLEGMKEIARVREEATKEISKLREEKQVYSNTVAPLLAKYGDRFQPGTTFGEVEQARAQNNAALLAEQAVRLSAVAASDRELFRQRTELEIQRQNATRAAEEAAARTQELRIRAAAEERETAESTALRAQMGSFWRNAPAPQQQQQRTSSSSSPPQNYSANRLWNLNQELEHENPVDQQQIMNYHKKKEVRPNMVLLRTREEFARAHGIAPPKDAMPAPYMAGQYCAASDDEIYHTRDDHTIRAHSNPWAMGLDKISMLCARDKVSMDDCLRTTRTREVYRDGDLGAGLFRRLLYSNEGGVGEAPNPMRHARETQLTAARELALGQRKPWPDHCIPGWRKPPQKPRR